MTTDTVIETTDMNRALDGRHVKRAFAVVLPDDNYNGLFPDEAPVWKLADNRTWETEAEARSFRDAILNSPHNSPAVVVEFRIAEWRVAHIWAWHHGDPIGTYFTEAP